MSELKPFSDSINSEFKETQENTFGGPGSGNFDHLGRPGKVGGSLPAEEKRFVQEYLGEWMANFDPELTYEKKYGKNSAAYRLLKQDWRERGEKAARKIFKAGKPPRPEKDEIRKQSKLLKVKKL